MTVTFCGHADENYGDNIQQKLYNEIETVINKGANKFFLGGYGCFDRIAASAVWSLKKNYPHIQSFLIIPYLNRQYDTDKYDGTLYPPIESIPKRYAILKRNEWMIRESEIVIAYVCHSWGGAAKTLEYAVKRKKYIINLFDI